MKLKLLKLKEKHATKRYCQWMNDKEVNKYLYPGRYNKKITIKDIINYVKEKNAKKYCLLMGIFIDKKHIGNVKYECFSGKPTIGIIIGEKKYWNKGIGTRVIKIFTKKVLKKFDLNKIELVIHKGNKSAIKVYLKCGYRFTKKKNKEIIMAYSI